MVGEKPKLVLEETAEELARNRETELSEWTGKKLDDIAIGIRIGSTQGGHVAYQVTSGGTETLELAQGVHIRRAIHTEDGTRLQTGDKTIKKQATPSEMRAYFGLPAEDKYDC